MKTVEKIISGLRAGKLKIAAAESCSGGLLADAFVSVPGASDVFLGSLVCYDPKIKRGVLGVPAAVLKRGVVSEECALEMAECAAELFKADIALAITGFADKSDEDGVEDGTVFVALSSKNGACVEKMLLKGPRNSNRKAAVKTALKMLEAHLEP